MGLLGHIRTGDHKDLCTSLVDLPFVVVSFLQDLFEFETFNTDLVLAITWPQPVKGEANIR